MNFLNKRELHFKFKQSRFMFQVDSIPPILQPLFPISSWSQDDLARDQRLLLEQELRERGLLGNQHAVEQILKLAPPSLPRPDQRSQLQLAAGRK